MTDKVTIEMVCAKERKLFIVEFERRSARDKYRPVRIVRRQTEVSPEQKKGFLERILTPVKQEPDSALTIGGVPYEAFDETAFHGLGCPHCDFVCREDGPPFGVLCDACGRYVCGGGIGRKIGAWALALAEFSCVCGAHGWRVMGRLPSVNADKVQDGIATTRSRSNRLLAAGKKRPALPSGKQGA